TVNADGGFIYTPKLNFTGTDSFEYQACDNGSPSLCQTRTVTIQVSGHPLIGLAKAGTDPVMKTDGSYDITYTLTVKNMGNVELSQVQVVDDLEKAFPAPLKYKVAGAPVVNGGLSGNILFNGNGDKNLLSSNSTLPRAGTATISFTVNVQLAGTVGTYFNSATASGTGQGITVTDISTPGNNPDPNNNGNPADPSEGGATETVLHGNAVLGIAKLVGTPIKQTDKSNLVTYSITVKNYGNVPLQNVQVTDDLSKTFPVPLQFSVEGAPKISSGILSPNLSFNGMGNNNLLAAGTILGVGQVDTIRFTVKVIPDENNYGPFNNIAVGTAQTAAGAQTTDISTSGKDPDPDKNGIPDEKVETGVMLEKSTIKAPEGFSPNGDGVNDGFVIENLDGERISLEIYNRWGNMIYKDSDYKNTWNGICNQGIYTGKDIPDGTYYYIVSKKDGKDKYIGFLTINR
ncbi:MAG TPA: gliding motility-associated C-terminal domain-containing protein, partial [Sphingobacteriaceae bacterium]